MQINFTKFLRERENHLEDNELMQLYADVILTQLEGVTGQVAIEYFQTGAVVTVDGEYYNTWNYERKAFHQGAVGDRK